MISELTQGVGVRKHQLHKETKDYLECRRWLVARNGAVLSEGPMNERVALAVAKAKESFSLVTETVRKEEGVAVLTLMASTRGNPHLEREMKTFEEGLESGLGNLRNLWSNINRILDGDGQQGDTKRSFAQFRIAGAFRRAARNNEGEESFEAPISARP